MGLFWRVNGGLTVSTVGICGLWCVQAGLCQVALVYELPQCGRMAWCAYLDEVLAFRLSDKRLKLRCGEGVDESSLGDDEKKDLSASENRQLVCLTQCDNMLVAFEEAVANRRAERVGRVMSATTTRLSAHLLHDTSLPLGEGDVPPRLVLDELDLNLSSLATWLVVIVVVVVGRSGGGARALDSSVLNAIAIVVVGSRAVLLLGVGDVCHGWFRCHSSISSIGLSSLGW